MKQFITAFILVFLYFHSLEGSNQPQKYVNFRISRRNVRYRTMLRALELMTQREAQIIIETGTSRNGCRNCAGDGCSTIIFGDWAKDHKADLYSVDINPKAIQEAKGAADRLGLDVHFVTGDSIEFLSHFEHPIDFLYLDSFDFQAHNPRPSQEHHLKEIQAAYHCLGQSSVVMIDDCNLPHGGKGKLAIEFLKAQGWKIDSNGYQVILTQN